MRTPVHVDLAPDMRAALEDHDDAPLCRQLNDLHRVWRGHESWAARRQAIALRVVFRGVAGVVVVHGRRPRHPGNPRLGLGAAASAAFAGARAAGTGGTCGRLYLPNLRQQLAVGADDPHRHVLDVRHTPDSFFTRHTSEIDRPIGQPGCGCGWWRSLPSLRAPGGGDEDNGGYADE